MNPLAATRAMSNALNLAVCTGFGRCSSAVCLVVALSLNLGAPPAAASELQIAPFTLDASPLIGSPLAYDPCDSIEIPLRCSGVVLLIEPQPVVVCAVDWIGIGNEANTYFRQQLADAAGTSIERVAVHTLHQHDAPGADLTAGAMLAAEGIEQEVFDTPWFRDVVARAAAAVKSSIAEPQSVTHLRVGSAAIEQVASNRRILGPDGKVLYTRWTATKDEAVRAMPVGTIDPLVRSVGFWNNDTALVTLTFYATHPQSYYRTRMANSDFPGMARDAREASTSCLHVHFNGAGGNIGAGKWNDGSPENRQVLADRVATGMRLAWEQSERVEIQKEDLAWKSVSVALPVASHLDETALAAVLADDTALAATRGMAAADLAWLRRCKSGETLDVGCLSMNKVRILFMPGELFIEYQLAAQEMLPDRFVAMAAYGDYGPGYIGTAIAYEQGGYETSQRASRVAPEVEEVLLSALRALLDDSSSPQP